MNQSWKRTDTNNKAPRGKGVPLRRNCAMMKRKDEEDVQVPPEGINKRMDGRGRNRNKPEPHRIYIYRMIGGRRRTIATQKWRGGGVESSWMEETSSSTSLPSMLISFIFILLHSSVSVVADSPCTDQLQHCGTLVEEFERQLHDLRNGAFRQCFTNTACVHEKIAFDDCYAKSLRAMRAPFGTNAEQPNNDFLTVSEAFRQRSEQCFAGAEGGATDEVLTVFGETSAGNATEGNNDGQEDVAHLAPVVFGAELADRLWALPSGVTSEQPLLDPAAACGVKEPGARVFGGGISRISGSQINNLNISCILGSNELDCYRQTLDRDPQHRLLVYSRDKALRSCLNNLRIQQSSAAGQCHFDRSPAQQSCICNAREELDNRMQSAILDCVQHSAVAQLYAALNNVGTTAGEALAPFPAGARYKPTESPTPAVLAQLGDEPISVPSSAAANGAATVLSQGSIVNGQCLCACPRGDQSSSSATRPGSAVIAASNNDYYPPAAAKINLSTAGGGTVVTPAAVAAGQQPQMLYRPLPAMPWYYQPVQTALSAEAGIASGFERFFNGQPPIRKKREEAERRNEKQERTDGTE